MSRLSEWRMKLDEKKKKMSEQIQRGREVSEQIRAERLRKKVDKVTNAKPGAITAIRKGLMTKSSPLDVMKEEWARRKDARNKD